MIARKSRSRTRRSIAFEPLETRDLPSVAGAFGPKPITATFTGTFASAVTAARGPHTKLILFTQTGTSTVPNIGVASLSSSFTEVVKERHGLPSSTSAIHGGYGMLTLTSAPAGGPVLAGVSINVFETGTAVRSRSGSQTVHLSGIYHVPYSPVGGHVAEKGTLTFTTATSGTISLTFSISTH